MEEFDLPGVLLEEPSRERIGPEQCEQVGQGHLKMKGRTEAHSPRTERDVKVNAEGRFGTHPMLRSATHGWAVTSCP